LARFGGMSMVKGLGEVAGVGECGHQSKLRGPGTDGAVAAADGAGNGAWET